MSKLILKSVDTEKAYKLRDSGIYVFVVPRNTSKRGIKLFVEQRYSVKVVCVNTVVLPRKKRLFKGTMGVLSQYKKAYVKLANGMRIDDGKGVVNEE